MNGSAALTLLVDAPAPIAVHGHDGAAGLTTAVGARQLRVAVPVKGEVPHQARLGEVLGGADHDVIHVPLHVTPPITPVVARAFCEVDLLVRERIVERVLAAGGTVIAVERDASEGVRFVLKL